jgi:4-oxalocrotonate tautomerase
MTSKYPPDLRTGEWEFQAFNADRSVNENESVSRCFSCHKSQAAQDFVYTVKALTDREKDVIMPHVIVKLWPGKSEQQKRKLAAEVTNAVTSTLSYGEESVCVGIEEVDPQDWTDKVYKPDIVAKRPTIYKEPGYDPL